MEHSRWDRGAGQCEWTTKNDSGTLQPSHQKHRQLARLGVNDPMWVAEIHLTRATEAASSVAGNNGLQKYESSFLAKVRVAERLRKCCMGQGPGNTMIRVIMKHWWVLHVTGRHDEGGSTLQRQCKLALQSTVYQSCKGARHCLILG